MIDDVFFILMFLCFFILLLKHFMCFICYQCFLTSVAHTTRIFSLYVTERWDWLNRSECDCVKSLRPQIDITTNWFAQLTSTSVELT